MDAVRTYTIILEPMDEGGFLVRVPALPEVVTGGDTEDEALATGLTLEDLRSRSFLKILQSRRKS